MLVEKSLAALRSYGSALPLRKAKGETGRKVAQIIARLEALADRVAARER